MRIMELYFKDLEDDAGAEAVGILCTSDHTTGGASDTAEDIAFAELSERVSAARLVY